MNTLSKTAQVNTTEKSATQKAENALWKKAEEARYGIIPMLLTVVACIGGIAASFGAENSIYQLSLIVFPTMMCLTFILAVAPMKLIIWSGIIAIMFDLIVFIA